MITSIAHPVRQSGAISGVAVDFILFPLDTVKTRIQSSQGFINAGGFKGVYRGVGSVGLGSAPGGKLTSVKPLHLALMEVTAATFFVTYEKLKEALPKTLQTLREYPGLNHLVSATGAEFVGPLHTSMTRVLSELVRAADVLLDPRSDRGGQITNTSWDLRT